jgi:hypothetical protein
MTADDPILLLALPPCHLQELGANPCATRTKAGRWRTNFGRGRTNSIPVRTNPGAVRTKVCAMAPVPKSVGCAGGGTHAPKEKEKNFSEVGENFVKRGSKKGRGLPLNKPVPKKHLLIMGTKLEKTIRIQAVISSIMILLREP